MLELGGCEAAFYDSMVRWARCMRNEMVMIGEQGGSTGADGRVWFACGWFAVAGCECRPGVFRCRCM